MATHLHHALENVARSQRHLGQKRSTSAAEAREGAQLLHDALIKIAQHANRKFDKFLVDDQRVMEQLT
eukprot:5903128-Pyramimonas_sp.AAC.1